MLEEMVLRHALGLLIPTYVLRSGAAGVRIIPFPRRGILRGVSGVAEAMSVVGIDGANIAHRTSVGVPPLPDVLHYLGIIFARGDISACVQQALREAHRCLRFVVEGAPSSINSNYQPECEEI